jgi:hypothetical protein
MLYTFHGEHPELPKEGDNEWYPMGRMVAAAFSLWRSAFLTDVRRDRETIYKHTMEFTEKVLKTNAITFADDHRMCELTVGYYNSNARYRLERMYHYHIEYQQIPSLRKIYDLRKEDVEKIDQRKMWDTYFEALSDCFDLFMNNWKARIRPSRNKTASEHLSAPPIPS